MKNKNEVELTEINEENIRMYKEVYKKSSEENDEEYTERIIRIIKDMNKFKEQQKIQQDIKHKEEAKENRKSFIVNLFKKFVKFTGVFTLSTGALTGGYIGVTKLGAYSAMKETVESGKDIQNDNYSQNTSVVPGYYNEHPISIKISNKFSDFEIGLIEDAIEYLDDAAEGVKFTKSVGDMNKSDAQVNIYHVQGDKVSTRGMENANGWATVPIKNAKNVRGSVCINTEKFHPFTVYQTTIHELMHTVFGILHSSDINSMMYPATSTWFLSKQDRININTIYPAASENETQNNKLTDYSSQESSAKQKLDKVFSDMNTNFEKLVVSSSPQKDNYVKHCSNQCENYISQMNEMIGIITKLINENVDIDREKLLKQAVKEINDLTKNLNSNIKISAFEKVLSGLDNYGINME